MQRISSGRIERGRFGNEANPSRKHKEVKVVIGDPANKLCRCSFTNKKSIEQNLSSLLQMELSQRRESSRLSGNFNFKSYRIFCTTSDTFDRTKKKEDSFTVRVRDFENTLREVCGREMTTSQEH